MALTSFGRDIFMRHTSTDGQSYVQDHRVWDAERFVFSQQGAAHALNRDAIAADPKAKTLASAEQITEDQFHSERKA